MLVMLINICIAQKHGGKTRQSIHAPNMVRAPYLVYGGYRTKQLIICSFFTVTKMTGMLRVLD
jgi:hypothetical protein